MQKLIPSFSVPSVPVSLPSVYLAACPTDVILNPKVDNI